MKKTYNITLEKAKELYPSASNQFKAELENHFSKKSLICNIIDKIKTFNDACLECGTTEKDFFKKYGKLGLSDDEIAYMQLVIITKALNEGWKPDWSNGDECKYYPYFKYSTSGFGFSHSDYADWSAGTAAGSRLCYKTSELAMYAGKQFEKIYNQFLK